MIPETKYMIDCKSYGNKKIKSKGKIEGKVP